MHNETSSLEDAKRCLREDESQEDCLREDESLEYCDLTLEMFASDLEMLTVE